MKSSEVNIAIFTEYSKAFDTIDFSILLKKMRALNFSKHFYTGFSLKQIDDITDSSISNISITSFGVPQGYILGPILFNFCVSDMTNNLSESQRIQYADNSTIYKSCKAKEVTKGSTELEKELKHLEQW